jgi:DNA polymerase I
MRTTWIALDMSLLAYRAFYSTGHLSYGDVKTGVVYGILRDMLDLEEQFGSSNFVFCFDHGESLRKQIFPAYKKHKDQTEEQKKARAEVRQQLRTFRCVYLPTLGYRNIVAQQGYEADDLIASLVNCRDPKDQVILVTSDTDLFQVLGEGVYVCRPKEKQIVDNLSFTSKAGCSPAQFRLVKAISGCKTDNIPGAGGVGIGYAAKFLTGTLNEKTSTYKKISEWIETEQYRTNLELVTVPMKGTKLVIPKRQIKVDPKVWAELCKSLGIHTLPTEMETPVLSEGAPARRTK